MIRLLWWMAWSPVRAVRAVRAGRRHLRDERHAAERQATVLHRQNALLARDAGLDLETLNRTVFGRPRPSQQGKGPR